MYIRFQYFINNHPVEAFGKRINPETEANPVYQCIVIDTNTKYYAIFTFTGKPTDSVDAQETIYKQKLTTVKQLLCLI